MFVLSCFSASRTFPPCRASNAPTVHGAYVCIAPQDQRSQDYDTMSVAYRPSLADATYDAMYGIRAVAGGGRSSARETIGRVAAAAVARKVGGAVSLAVCAVLSLFCAYTNEPSIVASPHRPSVFLGGIRAVCMRFVRLFCATWPLRSALLRGRFPSPSLPHVGASCAFNSFLAPSWWPLLCCFACSRC